MHIRIRSQKSDSSGRTCTCCATGACSVSPALQLRPTNANVPYKSLLNTLVSKLDQDESLFETSNRFAQTPKDLIADHRLTPLDKLIHSVLALEIRGRSAVSISNQMIADIAGIRRQNVIRCLVKLQKTGWISKLPTAPRQTNAYKLNHVCFGGNEGTATPAAPVKSERIASCQKCHRPCRRVGRSGHCRGCASDVELERQIRGIRATCPDVTPEEIAAKLNLHRLTARVRRVLSKVA